MTDVQMSILFFIIILIIGQLYNLNITMRNILRLLDERKAPASRSLEIQSSVLKLLERLEGPISRLDKKN